MKEVKSESSIKTFQLHKNYRKRIISAGESEISDLKLQKGKGAERCFAMDKKKHIYETHPVTGCEIPGFQFPYWNEVLEMCKKASFEIPEVGYIGWDVAITPTGPVFVEGNELPGYNLYQLPIHTPDNIGAMPKFDFVNSDKYKVNM